MTYRALGNIYYVPETNPSNIIPNTTFAVQVPIQQMAHDALVSAFPEAMQMVEGALPQLVNRTLPTIVQAELPQLIPTVVDQAWPIIEMRLIENAPRLVDLLAPSIDRAIEQHLPAAWDKVQPRIDATIEASVLKAEKAAAMGLAVTTGVVLLGGLALGRKMRWW